MIDLKFGLFWSGCDLSYLRYLTFKSLRHWHPDSTIELYISKGYKADGFKWFVEKQDFQTNQFAQTVSMEDIAALGVEIKEIDRFSKYPPNYQSDFFRWWWVKENGGFYLDTDQIILKSFKGLDRNCDFIYSAYKAPSCGIYTPVGVVGASKASEIVQWINQLLPRYYDPNNYNSLGPFMLRSVLTSRKWKDSMYNTGSQLFYPISDSCYVPLLYKNLQATEGLLDGLREAYALHWFGGHPDSQEFNASYTSDKAASGLDLISTILRDKEII